LGGFRLQISRSLLLKAVLTLVLGVGFFLAYEVGTIDSHGGLRSRKGGDASKPIVPGSSFQFVATAYCKGDATSAGVNVRAGIAAADPAILPEGSVILVEGVPQAQRGVYTVLDTGPMIVGRHVDLYIWSCIEALDFGHKDVTLTVLRLGWDPKNSSPSR
jgi:3D (Asp-Asp-Asp) domain-containing protein